MSSRLDRFRLPVVPFEWLSKKLLNVGDCRIRKRYFRDTLEDGWTTANSVEQNEPPRAISTRGILGFRSDTRTASDWIFVFDDPMVAGLTTCGKIPESNPGIEYNSTLSPSIAEGGVDFLEIFTTSPSVLSSHPSRIVVASEPGFGEAFQERGLSLLSCRAGCVPCSQ